MISVLTLTYKRPHLLEEAIHSYLSQDNLSDTEMVIINDNPEIEYVYRHHPQVRIINVKDRFPSISAKLEFGYKQCRYPYIYRLDDDDLLMSYALSQVKMEILGQPGFDIYRCKQSYIFCENVYEREGGDINNGNTFSKAFLDKIQFPDLSYGEDTNIIYDCGATIYETPLRNTMIYRWGMGTFHVSGMGPRDSQDILDEADRVLDDSIGRMVLHPHFKSNYYEQVEKYINQKSPQ